MAPSPETLASREPPLARVGTFATALRRDAGAILAGSVLPFALVLYLALAGGGYDAVVRSEVGVAVWWVVLLGAAVGVLPAARLGAAAWVGLGALAAFAAWTALGISWSDSSERSAAELARVATYLGVFVLALAAHGRDTLRRTVGAIAAAVALVGALALLSRLQPSWFPTDEVAAVFDSGRLNYPLDYWNGLAALMAIGVPLLLCVACESRRLLTQALATAAVPVLALTAFYTLSRGGAVEIAVALGAFLVLYPRRLAALPTLGLAAAGSGILIAAATQRDALEDGLATQAAATQGDEMLAVCLVVCAGVALLRVAVGLAARHGLGPRPRVSRAGAAAGFGLAAVLAAVIALAAGAPGELTDAWEEFKQPGGPVGGDTAERFGSVSGNSRYQWWQAALDANATDPLKGIGPGSYEYFWAREGDPGGFVRDAHSLYLETLAELGIVGFALIVALVVATLGYGALRALRPSDPLRSWAAAATAACAAFAVAAAIDWAWELAVLPITFLLLAAAILGGQRGRPAENAPHGPRALAPRAGLAALAVLALVAIAIPLASTSAVRASQSAAEAGALEPALSDARTASEIEPWAATPRLQEALVLELRGELDAAAAAARRATVEEPANWRTWFVLSRIEAYRGEAEASLAAYREARERNPRSPLFAR